MSDDKDNAVEVEISGEGAANAQAQEEAVEPVEEQVDELADLQSALEKSQAQAAEYLDGWQRARAEFANYKKRVEAEREDLRRRSNAELLLKLLPVADDFERAFEAVPETMAGEPWVEGISMVLHKLRSFLETQGVTPIEAVGQPFDPTLHEAIMQVETDEQPDGTVLDELQRGYKLGQRVLRPSMVRVASNPDDK